MESFANVRAEGVCVPINCAYNKFSAEKLQRLIERFVYTDASAASGDATPVHISDVQPQADNGDAGRPI